MKLICLLSVFAMTAPASDSPKPEPAPTSDSFAPAALGVAASAPPHFVVSDKSHPFYLYGSSKEVLKLRRYIQEGGSSQVVVVESLREPVVVKRGDKYFVIFAPLD